MDGAPAQLDAPRLPREARACLGRLLGVVLSKITLEPRLQPGPFLSASQGKRLSAGDQRCHHGASVTGLRAAFVMARDHIHGHSTALTSSIVNTNGVTGQDFIR